MRRLLFIASLALVLAACSKDEERATPRLISPAAVTYDSSCQRDTICFSSTGSWKAETDARWLTLALAEGTGAGQLPIYIQQNDAEEPRTATVTITTHDGQQMKVSLTQRLPDTNGLSYVNLPKEYGVGWGYDMKADVADVSGLRGQVFDAQRLINDYGRNAILMTNSSYSDLYYASGNSHEEMQQDMGAKFAGSADILIANAKVSVEYSNQIKETKDRRYVWCRTTMSVKKAFLGNNIQMSNKNLVNYCTTDAFYNEAMSNNSAEEFVKKFGTHLVIRSDLGGKFDYYFTVSQTVKTEVERIITHINVKILFIKKSWTEVDEKTWTDIKTDFNARYQVSGGGKVGIELNKQLKNCSEHNVPLEDPMLIDRWNACFTNPETANPDDLTMVGFNVIPIWNVVKTINPRKSKAIEEYVMGSYLK
jgi:nitrous oxide reductase accessory protein NosL